MEHLILVREARPIRAILSFNSKASYICWNLGFVMDVEAII
jgi:hypothetical protein